jgi:hypothetical protein
MLVPKAQKQIFKTHKDGGKLEDPVMPRSKSPPPSKAAERLREYLDIFDAMEAKRGKTLWYDIYRRAGNPYQTDSTLRYLEENGLIE